ncbi:MSCRAMM family protein [Companilactobacillus farciminis]|uniref:MSCRAMM family protein n=1 Tax=Companilactobacillus farciminis TaxID=1612 RepID=UPI00232FCA35|nr:SpaA isopeptide-forming pilin-related protein [Companilactobacillus farciminis]WCG36152.1 SpaA isopeptide-forming pilin-related protein [Companilactobacillus farciminis]
MKMKKSLIVASLIGLFLAFLIFFVPQISVQAATTTTTPTETTTSPPGSTATTTTAPTTSTTSQTTSTSPTITPKALTITGLGAEDATLTDINGNPVTPSDNLYTWLNYKVNYNWSIPDGVQINAGDTTQFTLPEGVVANADLSFPIYNSSNVEIGTATIKNGETVGTLTFNDVLSNTNANRKGTLTLVAKGTNTSNNTEGEDWMFNKLGWVAGFDANNVPNELTWNIAFNPNEHNLSGVVITDTLGPNQEYIPGSLSAIGGSYGTGGFVSNGQQLNPTVTTDGNKVIISFPGNVTTAVDIYYRVKVTGTNADGSTTWTNNATMASSEGSYNISASTSWGGFGTGNGDENVGSVSLQKTDSTTGKALSGAEYQLANGTGYVIISNAETDENGQINIKNLPYGSYTMTEVKAPDGYLINSSPIEFTIPDADGNTDLKVSQADKAIPGSVILTKADAETKNPIAGATFELLDSTGKVIQSGLVTDSSGKLAIDDLPVGDYSLVETAAAPGYELDATPLNFTIALNQTTPLALEKFNTALDTTPETGSVVLTKVDSSDISKVLPGAVYDLVDSTGAILQTGLTTDSNGQITVPDLPTGTYSFVETKAPEGYQSSLQPISFTISKGETTQVEAKDTLTEEDIPVVPGEPENPGTTTPPTTSPENPSTTEPPVTGPTNPSEPENPGTVEPPTTNPTNPSEPEAPSTTEPPVTNPESPSQPENPSTTEPPVTNPESPEKPENPGTTEPSVTNPESPSQPENPGTTEPSVTSPESPSQPEAPSNTEPVYPEIPGTQGVEEAPSSSTPYPVIPGTSSNMSPSLKPSVSTSGTSNSTIPTSGQSSYEKGTFPQTGNENGLFMMISGLFIALFLLLKYWIKKLSY